MEKFIEKLINNKFFLFIVPNLIYIYAFLSNYNTSLKKYISTGEILFYEVIILSGVFWIINFMIYSFLKKGLKDKHKLFFVMCLISSFYFIKMNIIVFLIYIIFILLFVFLFKKFVHFNLEKLVCFISFIIIFLFVVQIGESFYLGTSILLKSKGYSNKINIQVEENTSTPNIYWIHCDGMMSFYDMEKYFNYKDNSFQEYLEKNNYSYNEKASLIAGHRTQSALVALFNPYYYDHFYKDYLLELEDSFIQERESTFTVNYYELEEKRLSNELFAALDKKKYTTIAIADFNSYTGLYTDYFYDFFYYDKDNELNLDKQEFRYMDNHDMKEKDRIKLLSFMRFQHFKTLLNTTMLFPVLQDINYLDYDIIPYEKEDFREYPNTSETNYWISKAILSGIHQSLEIENQKFVFIDFKLNHLPINFNTYGEFLTAENRYNLSYYSGNYNYSTKLLMDILDYIKNNDENAIIFVQGDHGLHTLDDKFMRNYFNISQKDIQEIRNSVINAYYIPNQYKNGDEVYLSNPLNISRYLVNNYVGNNYLYLD